MSNNLSLLYNVLVVFGKLYMFFSYVHGDTAFSV